jgi:hypothetical protein
MSASLIVLLAACADLIPTLDQHDYCVTLD